MFYQLLWLSCVIVLGTYLFYPAPELSTNGSSIIIRSALTLLIYVYVSLTALGIGRKVLRFSQALSCLEFYLLALIIGFAVIADGILVLGLLRLLQPFIIFLWLALSGLFASFAWREFSNDILIMLRSFAQIRLKSWGGFEFILFGVTGFCIIFLPIVALAPVRDYDALMYHLEIPRQYLEYGGVYFNPESWRSTYPMLTEMLFLIGVAFHLEPLAQLFSLTFCAVFFLSVYAFGRRFFDSSIALLATGILLGNPAFPIYATSPSVDFSWASYELWSLYAFSLWLLTGKPSNENYWLIIAGTLSGFAASTKYLSFPTILIIGLLISLKTIQSEKADYKKLAQNILIYGFSVLIVIAPWYLKNWIWTGNPFYPLVFGGVAWTPLRHELIFSDYMGSFGTGQSLLDYLLLPINLYISQPRFATMSLEIFHPVLWLAFVLVFNGIWKKYDHLFAYIALGLALWIASAQVIRFLLPISGFLALFSAKVLSQLSRTIKQSITYGIVGSLMIVTLIYQIWLFADSSLLSYFNGKLSVSEFLQKEVYDYNTTQFIQTHLQKTDRVLFLWTGQGYYCDSRCLPDTDESLAVQLGMKTPNPETLAHQLHLEGVTHILLGRPTAYWFISLHDPKDRHRLALEYFENVFLPTCAKSVYSDGPVELFSITCK